MILLPSALAARGAALGEAFVGSLTMGAGQFCTNPGLVLAIEGDGLDAFVAAAAAKLGEHAPQPMLTGGIRSAFAQGTAALAANARVEQIASGIEGDGGFSWKVSSKGKTQDITGNWSLTNGVLTLAQAGQGGAMVGNVSWQDKDRFAFRAMGTGPNDPGLTFTR